MNDPQFDRAASLILDAVEIAFDIVPAGGRSDCHRAVVAILNHYCLPKNLTATAANGGTAPNEK